MKRKWLWLVAAVVLLPAAAVAQFFGSIVFDPSSYATLGHIWAQDISTYAKVLEEIAQLVKIYNNAVQTYNQIYYNALSFQNKGAWRGIATPTMLSNTATIFGETAGWNQAVTQGSNVPGAWQEATYQINPPPFWSAYPIGQSSISANIASVNVADGMSQAGMATVANSRLNQPMNDLALTNLEQTSQDTSLGTNSEVEQLNLLTSGTVLSNRQLEDANALLTTIAEQQVLQNKTIRDTIADNLNVYTVADQYFSGSATQWGNSADTIMNYRQ